MLRTDITVDWSESPRVITVAAPSTVLLMQDLVDTLREAEAGLLWLTEPRLLDAAGKSFLKSGVYTGITVTLNDALVAFEARPGPEVTRCYISGNLVAVDADGVPMDPTLATDYVHLTRELDTSGVLVESDSGISDFTAALAMLTVRAEDLAAIIAALTTRVVA